MTPDDRTAPRSPIASKGPVTYQCTMASGGSSTISATFYDTKPPLVLVERGMVTRPAFGVVAASGAKGEGPDVIFWEARGEVSLIWSGARSTCRPR